MQDLIEIEKKELSCYYNLIHIIKKLNDEKKDLYYELSGVKGVNYEKQKAKSYNKYLIEYKKIKISEEIEKKEKEIKKQERKKRRIEVKLRRINRKNDKRGNYYPSDIIVNVLCKRKTYKQAREEYDFTSNSSLTNYIDKCIRKMLEE